MSGYRELSLNRVGTGSHGEEAEGRPEWVPAGVGSGLFLDSITAALATLAWWLHYLPGDIPGLCSVPRGRWNLSKLKSDPVSPYLSLVHC